MAGAFTVNAEDLRYAPDPGVESFNEGLRVKIAAHLERVAEGLRIAGIAGAGLQGFGADPTLSVSLASQSGLDFGAGLDAGKLLVKVGAGLLRTGSGVELDQGFAPVWTALHTFNTPPRALGDPVDATELARRSWVLNQIDVAKLNFDIKDSVRVATTVNIALSGEQTIDDVAVIAGNRVLVRNQTAPAENGIYKVASGAWTRSEDADSNAEVTSGLFTSVEEGTANKDSRWVLTTDGPISLGTTALAFARYDAGSLQAGAGLVRTADTFDVQAADGTIEVLADGLRVRLDAGGAIALEAGGLAIALEPVNPALRLAGNRLDVKYQTAKGLAADVGGLLVAIGEAMEYDPGGLVRVKVRDTGGIARSGDGIEIKRDVGAGGQLATNSLGARVAIGGAGLSVRWEVEDHPANTFAHNGGTPGISTKGVGFIPSGHPSIRGAFALLKSGLDNMKQVEGAPAVAGDWRLNGQNVEISGNVTGSGDVYRIRYTRDV